MNEKIELPKRTYYPLTEAVKKLNCSLNYIYHLAARGEITLAAYIPMFDNRNKNHQVYIPFEGTGSIEKDKYIDLGNLAFANVNESSRNNSVIMCDFDVMRGFAHIVGGAFTELEFDSNKKSVSVLGLSSSSLRDGLGIFVQMSEKEEIDIDKLCIFESEMNLITSGKDKDEHPRTSNKKGEIIPYLLKMIPEFSNVDIDTAPASKISNILEKISATKGMELPIPDKNTFARYLGRR